MGRAMDNAMLNVGLKDVAKCKNIANPVMGPGAEISL